MEDMRTVEAEETEDLKFEKQFTVPDSHNPYQSLIGLFLILLQKFVSSSNCSFKPTWKNVSVLIYEGIKC